MVERKSIFDTHQRELFEELVHTQAWNLFVDKLIRSKLRALAIDVVDFVRANKFDKAAHKVAYRDAIIDIVATVYNNSNTEVPDFIKQLRYEVEHGQPNTTDGYAADGQSAIERPSG